jgi:glucose dehydrogenase
MAYPPLSIHVQREVGVERALRGVVDELEAQGIANTGAPSVGGPIATSSGLVLIGATGDKRFHAFDAKSGKEL